MKGGRQEKEKEKKKSRKPYISCLLLLAIWKDSVNDKRNSNYQQNVNSLNSCQYCLSEHWRYVQICYGAGSWKLPEDLKCHRLVNVSECSSASVMSMIK